MSDLLSTSHVPMQRPEKKTFVPSRHFIVGLFNSREYVREHEFKRSNILVAKCNSIFHKFPPRKTGNKI